MSADRARLCEMMAELQKRTQLSSKRWKSHTDTAIASVAVGFAGDGLYRVYQNDWSGLEVDYIYKYGEETYKY